MSTKIEVITQETMSEQVNKMFWINPRKVLFNNNDNIRSDGFDSLENLEELKQSILSNGVKMPIICHRIDPLKNNGYEYKLTHGYRRMNAVIQLINDDSALTIRVPANVTKPKSELDILLDHITYNSSKTLGDNELAIIIDKLENFGLTRNEISTKVGLSTARISQILSFKALVDTDNDIRQLVDSKLISNTEISQQLSQSKDKTETKEVMKLAVEEAKKSGKKKVTKKDIKAVEQELGLTSLPIPEQVKKESTAKIINKELNSLSNQNPELEHKASESDYEYEVKKFINQVSMISDNFVSNVQGLITDKVKLLDLDELTANLVKFVKASVE